MLFEQHSDAADLYDVLKKKVETDLEELKRNHAADLTILKDSALSSLIAVNNNAVDKMNEADENFRNNMIVYEKTIREWGKEKVLEGRFKEIFRYAEIIYDINENQTRLKEIPVYLIERFVFTAMYWVYENTPDATSLPDISTHKIDSNFSPYTEYKMLAIMNMASQYFAVLRTRTPASA